MTEIFVSSASARTQALVQEAEALGVKVSPVSRARLDALAQGGAHQGVIALAAPRRDYPLDDLWPEPPEKPLLLVLDQVQDPQNLGSLMRSAVAFGGHGLVLPARHAAHVTPAAVKASAGASEMLKVSVVANLARSLAHLKDRGVWIIGLDARADQTVDEAPWDAASALVLGNEGRGLRRLTQETCDLVVRIPMSGRIDSLGVAAAGAVALAAAFRTRHRA